MRKIISSISLLFFFIFTYGAEHHLIVRGWVGDAMGEYIAGVRMSIMTADSVLIDTTSTGKEGVDIKGFYTFVVNKAGKYIIKASKEGYEDGYADFSFLSLRANRVFPPEIRLIKVAKDLPEVVVRASKIKMVLRGDTIVYNADAFNLADGSMLEALIRRLPGTKLNKDGQIFVNGKYARKSALLYGEEHQGL